MPRSILLLLRQIFLFKERSKDQESNPLVTVRVNSKQSVRGLRSSITDHACPSVPLTSIFIPEQNVNERPPRESYLSADKRRGGPPMDAMLSLGELQTFALAPRFLTPPIWIRFWQELMVERVRKKMLRERDWDRNLRLCTPCETKSKGGREKQEARYARTRDASLCRNVINMTNYVLHIWRTATTKNQAPFFCRTGVRQRDALSFRQLSTWFYTRFHANKHRFFLLCV